jgi:hypothetical protein
MNSIQIDPTGAAAAADQARIVAEQNQKIGNDSLAIMQKAMAEFDNSPDIHNHVENPDEISYESIADAEPAETEVEEVNEEEQIAESEAPKEKEKILSKEAKYRKLQKEKYRALAEKESERAEKEEALRQIDELKRLLGESYNSNVYYTSKSAETQLEKAKQDKRIAIESGDMDALISADIALAEAIAAVSEAKKWNAQINQSAQYEVQPKAEHVQQPPQKVQQNNNYDSEDNYEAINQEVARDWLDSHSYLQPRSKDYNPTLAKQVSAFVKHLDNSLHKNDQMDLYFSEDYFDTIDEFIAENINKPRKIDRSILNASHIGGVRHGHTPSVNGGVVKKSKAPDISDMERIMMKHAGIPESSLIKAKINMAKEGKF